MNDPNTFNPPPQPPSSPPQQSQPPAPQTVAPQQQAPYPQTVAPSTQTPQPATPPVQPQTVTPPTQPVAPPTQPVAPPTQPVAPPMQPQTFAPPVQTSPPSQAATPPASLPQMAPSAPPMQQTPPQPFANQQATPTNTTNEIRAGATLPVQELAANVRREVAKAVVGQDAIITQFLVALLVRGHILLEGVPGVAKTLTSRAVARALSADFKRIQFTPDLMPSDVTGTNVFDAQNSEFSLRRGPVFTDLLLADEINRTPPKTQAALLEAMQERRVTIDGEPYQLSPLFTVLATQNPVDYEGTYPLPEAQLDRFLMKVEMGYPSPDEEAALLVRVHRGFDAHELSGVAAVAGAPELNAARLAVRNITVSDGMIRYVTQIVTRTRGLPTLTLGASPRASIALLECAKAHAAMDGRDYMVPEDVKAMARPVLRHRLLLRAESEMDGVRPDDIVNAVVSAVEVPR